MIQWSECILNWTEFWGIHNFLEDLCEKILVLKRISSERLWKARVSIKWFFKVLTYVTASSKMDRFSIAGEANKKVGKGDKWLACIFLLFSKLRFCLYVTLISLENKLKHRNINLKKLILWEYIVASVNTEKLGQFGTQYIFKQTSVQTLS